MKKNYLGLILLTLIISIFTGCSHKITIDPKLDTIRAFDVDKKVNVNVGYYISKEDKNKKVITPGGGGDKVDYTPYKDTEAALNTVLSKIFSRVYSIDSLQNKEFITTKNIKYIFLPTIKTNSSSESLFTWPPTKFTFELTCKATDTNNNLIWEDVVYAEGFSDFDEFKNNFSLSAQRATEKAFLNMLVKLKQANEFTE